MKVIFLKDVAKVARKYDIKNVSDGHALNFLIPRGLAKIADSDSVKKIEGLKKELEAERVVQENLLIKSLNALEGKEVEYKQKANDKGHLFGSIHQEQLAELISKSLGMVINPSYITLDKPIKEVGVHEVEVKVNNKSAKLKFVVVAE